MSLVYDALRQQAEPARPGRPQPRASWWARQSPSLRGGMLLAAGAVLAAPLALLVAGGFQRTPSTAAVAAVPDVGPGAAIADVAPAASFEAADTGDDIHADTFSGSGDVADADAGTVTGQAEATVIAGVAAMPPSVEAPSAPSASSASTEVPQTVAVAEPTNAAASPGTNAPDMPMAAAAATPQPRPLATIAATPQPQPAPINIKVEQRGTAHANTAGQDAAAVERAIRGIEAAVAARDFAGAHDALAGLETVLHADSLTLLRMRAWVAHGSDDMRTAEQLYRQIAERVPDDLNAGVNIALLDANRGDVANARHRLLRLAGRHSRSPQVAHALAELEALSQ